MKNDFYNSRLYRRFLTPVFDFFSDFKWETLKLRLTGRSYNLTKQDWDYLERLLKADHYIILTRRSSHLTTYLITIADWLKRPRWGWGHYSHVLANVQLDPMVFMESIKGGVKLSDFSEIFNCDSVCLLRTRHYTRFDWGNFISEAYENLGRPYDNGFDVNDQSHMSCAEVIRDCLREMPDYQDRMVAFESMIWDEHNLTPQMFYDCHDFEIVFEIRR